MYLHGSADDLADARVELLAESLCVQVPEDDAAEDAPDHGFLKLINVQDVEMP